MAFHGSNSYNETGLSKITDIVGWNLYQDGMGVTSRALRSSWHNNTKTIPLTR